MGYLLKSSWALPGGFVDIDEDLAACALRELEEETGVAYYALVPPDRISIRAASDAKEVAWFKLDKLPPLGPWVVSETPVRAGVMAIIARPVSVR